MGKEISVNGLKIKGENMLYYKDAMIRDGFGREISRITAILAADWMLMMNRNSCVININMGNCSIQISKQ